MAKVNPIPEGMHTVTPQLNLEGAADAIEFYKKAFGAKEVARALDPAGKKVMHAEVRIGDSPVFVNDVFPEMGEGAKASRSNLWLYVEDVDQAFKRATDAGAHAKLPPTDMFWGDRMAQVTDKWGVYFTIAQRVKNMTPEEMKKAADEFFKSMKR